MVHLFLGARLKRLCQVRSRVRTWSPRCARECTFDQLNIDAAAVGSGCRLQAARDVELAQTEEHIHPHPASFDTLMTCIYHEVPRFTVKQRSIEK